MKRNVYSVGQVNQYIKTMFAQDFLLRNICVRGEVSNWTHHTSGHIFFSLKDRTGVLSAVMFAGEAKTGLAGPVKNGDQVEVVGSVRLYEKGGRYQLYAREIQAAGAGALYQRFEALKRELEEMGMFAPEYKKAIPAFPQRVGVVTAPTGAAIRDIQNISARRNPFVQMILYPALVQGEGAAESVAAGIRALEAYGVDVIIIGRGGGSMEDLWAFNEELLARQIFSSSVPVVSAVGHETDTTIADFVADLRAPTPSAAAELVVPDIRDIISRARHAKDLMTRRMGEISQRERARIQAYTAGLRMESPAYRLQNRRQYLAESQDRMAFALQKQIREKKNALDRAEGLLPLLMEGRLADEKSRLCGLSLRLPDRMKQVFGEKRHALALYASRLDAVSPLKKLGGGYGYLEDPDGKGIRSVGQVQAGDMIRARLADGSFRALVSEVENERTGKEGSAE